VVVAARNEENNIGNLLSELVQQTYPSDSFEVIIVNDGSEDRTGAIIDQFALQYKNVRHVPAAPDLITGLTAKKNALNQGIQQSTGDIILTTDADCHVKPTWIESMVSYFTETVGVVVGFSQLGNRNYPYSFFEGLQASDFLSLMSAAQGSINLNCPLAASGQNLAYRKDAFEAVDGFQKIKNRISGDDVLLLQLIRKYSDWKIRFASSEQAFNWTQPEKTFQSFFNQRKRWASNGSYQMRLNIGFFIFILVVFLMNVVIILGSPIYFLIYHSVRLPLLCLLTKLLIELAIALKGSVVYQRIDLMKFFPVWAIVQMPYVILTGLMGSLGRFIWKERRYFQELTIFRTSQ
jgi:cellulose synthase/poly-beta-1,6-N-acetylglucosamine synthase-like glycosyltransferase